MKPLILGSRGSPLALAQTHLIRDLLRDVPTEIRIIKTRGDLFPGVSLAAAGGKGLFTKEIEDQLLAGTIDVAIHSLKDLPTTVPAGLVLAATPPREDARDMLFAKQARSVEELPVGARVATSSLRRRAQLLARRPDLRIEEMRGNIGTRLQKLAARADLDALVLAAAGVKRLGLPLTGVLLEVDVMLPAVGQGIIGCEARETDARTRELLAAINDAGTRACAEAERSFLHAIGGGCQLPYAAHATVTGNELCLVAARFAEDGTSARRATVTGPVADARAVGERAAVEIRG